MNQNNGNDLANLKTNYQVRSNSTQLKLFKGRDQGLDPACA